MRGIQIRLCTLEVRTLTPQPCICLQRLLLWPPGQDEEPSLGAAGLGAHLTGTRTPVISRGGRPPPLQGLSFTGQGLGWALQSLRLQPGRQEDEPLHPHCLRQLLFQWHPLHSPGPSRHADPKVSKWEGRRSSALWSVASSMVLLSGPDFPSPWCPYLPHP